MTRSATRAAILGLAVTCFVGGVAVDRWRPWEPWRRAREARAALDQLNRSRPKIPFAILDGAVHARRVLVIVAIGQSNAGNHGGTPSPARAHVFNWYQNSLRIARDPLLGGTGDRGSVWMRLADTLLATSRYDAIVFAPIAGGGRFADVWGPGTAFRRELVATVRELRAAGLEPSAFLWAQGETDAQSGTHATEYAEMLRALIGDVRSAGGNAPFYVARSTRCDLTGHPPVPSPTIRAADSMVIATVDGVRPGPDTDTLGPEFRRDGCHYNDHGLDTAAGLWARALSIASF